LLATLACNRPEQPFPRRQAPGGPRFGTAINKPRKLDSIESGRAAPGGIAGRVPCETCHSLREEKALPSSASELEQFHRGLRVEHGSIGCSSCHAVGNPPSLHLANGERLAMTDALRLCAQCHGPQYRDYKHGAHGGMNGYWDLSSGGRVRNNCVDCHDPHLPKIPQVTPVRPPRDRFLSRNEGEDHGR
jgi:hypothetical protein